MKRLFLALAFLLAFAVIPAKAERQWQDSYGQWEIFAWKGYWNYCAAKTYVDSRYEISLRQDSDGHYLAILIKGSKIAYDPYYTVELGFDGFGYGVYKTFWRPETPGMVYIRFGHDYELLENFMSSSQMNIRGDAPNGSWFEFNLGLAGSRYVGENLQDCVDTFGF